MRVLMVEDSRADARLIEIAAGDTHEEVDLVWESRLGTAVERAVAEPFDAVLLDLNLADTRGLETVKEANALLPDLPLVVLTGLADREMAHQALQIGAQDFLEKGSVNGELLGRSLRYAVERHGLQQELRELAMVDELTGVANRRGFRVRVESRLRLARRERRDLWILFVDVDGLKKINDTHGHGAGDRAIALVAETLESSLRESDIVGRLGGDEFAALVMEGPEHLSGCEILRQRVEEAVRRRSARADLPFPVRVTVGTVHCRPEEVQSHDELLAAADEAMYAARAGDRETTVSGGE